MGNQLFIRVPREEARNKLQKQIKEGRNILNTPINNQYELQCIRKRFERWRDYTSQLLLTLYTTNSQQNEFLRAVGVTFAYPGFSLQKDEFYRQLGENINKLQSFFENLELFQNDMPTDVILPSGEAGGLIDKKVVFVVHGRNERLNNSMFDFLRAIGLEPREWLQALTEAIKETGSASPYIGDILDVAFRKAWAAVVLVTGDDYAKLRVELASKDEPGYETKLTPQARPNVIFEAGMAIAKYDDRTILVEIGNLRWWSDIRGRYIIRLDDSSKKRKELVEALKAVGCAVDDSGTRWLDVGQFVEIPRSEQQDRNRQETTGESEESATTEKQILLTQANHLKDRIVQRIEATETTLAPDFAIELSRLFLRAFFEWALRQEIISMKSEFEALAAAKLNDKLALLKTTLNSVNRLITLMETLG